MPSCWLLLFSLSLDLAFLKLLSLLLFFLKCHTLYHKSLPKAIGYTPKKNRQTNYGQPPAIPPHPLLWMYRPSSPHTSLSIANSPSAVIPLTAVRSPCISVSSHIRGCEIHTVGWIKGAKTASHYHHQTEKKTTKKKGRCVAEWSATISKKKVLMCAKKKQHYTVLNRVHAR